LKILLVGDWHSELHEEVVFHSLRRLNQEVLRFSWYEYFRPSEGQSKVFDTILKKAQNKYLIGPLISRINKDLITCIAETLPHVIFIYRGTHIWSKTLREIRLKFPEITLVGYNNDDPFSPRYSRRLWKHFLAGIPEYDLMLAYRYSNLEDFRAAGARRVELLRSWYVPERNHPIELKSSEQEEFSSDVVFVGHYENDGRLEALEAVAAAGYRLRIFGPGWNRVLRGSRFLASQIPVRSVWGEDYNRALCGSRIALCFLSKLNRDTYTRRCFEIPAAGTMMLAEYSEDLATLFTEGREIEMFRSPDELISKIQYYLRHAEQRRALASAGLQRVMEDGHDVDMRMSDLMEWIRKVNLQKYNLDTIQESNNS